MKKILALLLCLNIFLVPVWALLIEDEFVDETLDKNLKIKKSKYIPIADNLSENKYQEIKIRIKNEYSTKDNLDEGDYIDFVTVEDVKLKDKIYPKDSIVKARIETISQNKAWGVPSDLIVGNFTLDNNKLTGEISKTGANRSLWLYPAVEIGCIFLGAGLLLIPIRGGHAKIKPTETYSLYVTE